MNLKEIFKDVKKVWYFGEEYHFYYASDNRITITKFSSAGWTTSIDLPKEQVEELMRKGNLKIIPETKKTCFHNWVKYTGFREVYHYCEKCNEKQAIDWRTLK